MSSRFYITTPIYYPNAEPHIGSCYTTIACDALARYHRLIGDDTFFLTGTDEHGIRMAKTAESKGLDPKAFADSIVAVFRDLWKELGITNDDFIRTTDQRHKESVTKIVQQLLANGDIYLGSYTGWYDEGQEEFVTETAAKENEYQSLISGRPLVRFEEPSYFFKLSKYVPQVIQHIESNPEFLRPEIRRNEVLSKLRAGVEDLSISRSSFTWGIPLPNDPKHVLYVWIDALSNYITALGYGSSDDSKFRRFWPADLHLIGKDILWFHTVYWPAMLMSLGLPLPKTVYAHGFWTAEGRKMSKSLGNTIDLVKIRAVIQTYSLDALRYYVLRAAPFGNDLDWTDTDFSKSFNELANVVGNCLNRSIKMIGRYRNGVLPAASNDLDELDRSLVDRTKALSAQVATAYQRIDLQQCALLPIELARATNGYIDATAPFTLAKDPAKAARLDTVLNLSVQAIYQSLVALLPILPEKAAAGLAQLGVQVQGKSLKDLIDHPPFVGKPLGEGQPLFPRVEEKK
jgi:methionyl-tRNA synthetase